MKKVLAVVVIGLLAVVAALVWLSPRDNVLPPLDWPAYDEATMRKALDAGQHVFIFVSPLFDAGTFSRTRALCEEEVGEEIRKRNVACFQIADNWALPETQAKLDALKYHALRGGLIYLSPDNPSGVTKFHDEPQDQFREAVLAQLRQIPLR